MPSVDYLRQRNSMVDSQVRTDDVTHPPLVAALRGVEREAFVPDSLRAVAYIGEPLQIAPGRFLLDARTFAKLCQLAEITPADTVLVVGGATGYSAAVLARLAAHVTLLESDAGLAEAAATNLASAGVTIARGPLAAGWPAKAPYTLILLDGAVPVVPETLLAQLAPNGRLVGVVTDKGVGKAHIFIKAATGLSSRIAFDATVPTLAGFESAPHFVF